MVMVALLLTTANLFAGATANWVSGGPNPGVRGVSKQGAGYVNGDITSDAEFNTPGGIAMDVTGNYLLVADRSNNVVRVLEFDNNTAYTLLTFAGPNVVTNLFHNPIGVAIDSSYNIFVLNRGNGKNGNVLEFDSWGDLIATNAANLTNAAGMALDPSDNIYVTINSNTLLKITSPGVSVVVATIANAGTSLQGIIVKHNGLIAACDSGRNGIYLINPTSGAVITNAGFNGAGDFYSANNNDPISRARFFQPTGIAEAGDGSLIVTDFANDRIKVVSGTIVTNLYGVSSNYWSGTFPGLSGGTSGTDSGLAETVLLPDSKVPNANARMPYGVTFAPDGSIYVTEDYYHIIRHITGAGFPPPPPPAPGAPTILTVTTNFGQVSLTWTTVPGATSYNVKRSTTSGGPTYQLIGNTATTSFIDTANLANGMTYYYVVSALNTGGESPNSPEVSATLPMPPVANPQIGYVDIYNIFQPGTSFFFNNDVPIVIESDPTALTYYTYSNTVTAALVPNPGTNSSPAPAYQSGLNPSSYIVAQIMPQLTIKAISIKNDGSPNSQVAQATFQFVTGNPVINGANAAQFTIRDITANAHLYYTLDGSDPSTNGNAADLGTTPSNAIWTVSFPIQTNTLFKVRAFRDNYQPSEIVSNVFTTASFQPNVISFGFASGEASSDFVASPGQIFYAPVTLTVLPATAIYSLQFNITVTNLGPVPQSGVFDFTSLLEKPDLAYPGLYLPIPTWVFVSGGTNPPPATDINAFKYQGDWYQDLQFVNGDLLGAGWIERYGATNLYNTLGQDLIAYSSAHDVIYPNPAHPLQIELGGYALLIPPNATTNDSYQIRIGRPTATSDGIGIPGSDVYIVAPTNGSTAGGGPINGLKNITIGQRKYIVGSVYPFRWFNAGDFGSSNIVNADIEQVFEAAAYGLNVPLGGSDFYDGMDSCGNIGVLDSNPVDANNGYYTNTAAFPSPFVYTIHNYTIILDTNNVPISTNISSTVSLFQFTFLTTYYVNEVYTNTYINPGIHTNIVLATNTVSITPTLSTSLFDGGDTNINQIVFGDGVLDVCDVYVTFRRSLDPSLTWFRRFWNNGERVADTGAPNVAPQSASAVSSASTSFSAQSGAQNRTATSPLVNFTAGDIIGSAGQTVQIPINATVFGIYPLRVLMLNLNVTPLDGSPALTSAVQFTPNPALGDPYTTDSKGNGNYTAVWLDNTISGLTGTTSVGTLTVTIPANATGLSAYAIHFDHASASPNGIASFPKQTLTGMVTLSSRTSSSYGDGIPDLWRLRWFGTVNNILSVSNACPSGDGISNWQKYVAGVDPSTPDDFPSLNSKAPVPAGATAAIHWPTVSGKQYVILRSSSLFPGAWSAIATNTGTGTDMEFDDTTTGQTRFYRVQILP
jgi:hypothetical protein